MSLSPEAVAVLFDRGVTSWSVYFRPRRGSPWQLVGTAASHADAVALIGEGGRRGGDWLLTEVGQRAANVG